MKDRMLIESGATKSDWRLLRSGEPATQVLRGGMNVSSMPPERVKEVLAQGFSEIEGPLDGVYLYTAGVVTDAIRTDLEAFIRSRVQVGEVDIQDDLMGAARAVCGRQCGIAAILGTGSNTCFYDGTAVHRKVYSGGFILGDEGSGAALGRLFLADFIKGIVPEAVAEDFRRQFDGSYAAIVEAVYRSGAPSGYLGSIAPFLLSHYEDSYVKGLVDGNFQAFIDRALRHYDCAAYPVGIAGGFGWACRDILTPLLAAAGIRVSRFVRQPVDALCEYHSAS